MNPHCISHRPWHFPENRRLRQLRCWTSKYYSKGRVCPCYKCPHPALHHRSRVDTCRPLPVPNCPPIGSSLQTLTPRYKSLRPERRGWTKEKRGGRSCQSPLGRHCLGNCNS